MNTGIPINFLRERNPGKNDNIRSSPAKKNNSKFYNTV